jgi:hypothetical protein
MTEYHFRLIVGGPFSEELSDEELLNATDALGAAGCDDASVSVHADGLELEFARSHQSLQGAIASAVQDVERAGFRVESIEMDREAVLPAASP